MGVAGTNQLNGYEAVIVKRGQYDCAPGFVFRTMSSVQCQRDCALRAVQQRPALGYVGTVENIVMQSEAYSLESVIVVEDSGMLGLADHDGRQGGHTEFRSHAVSDIEKRVVYSPGTGSWQRGPGCEGVPKLPAESPTKR